jgi:hypothetical protein
MRHGDILSRQRSRPEWTVVAAFTIVCMVAGVLLTVVLVQATSSMPTIRMPGSVASLSR